LLLALERGEKLTGKVRYAMRKFDFFKTTQNLLENRKLI